MMTMTTNSAEVLRFDMTTSPWSLVRVLILLEVDGGRWEFMSHPLEPVMADILQRNLASQRVKVLWSKIIPAERAD